LLIGFFTAHGGSLAGGGDSAATGQYPGGGQGAPGFGANEPTATQVPPPSASGATPASQAPTSPPATSGPAATVQAAYAAINAHDYQEAYSLGLGDPAPGESLQQYAAGYAETASVAVTIVAVQGNTVTVTLNATLTDGTQQTFAGSYTVSGGRITGASMQQTS
jgi:hypothetical protein